MTTLIKGFTVLQSTEIKSEAYKCTAHPEGQQLNRYRFVLDSEGDRYGIHLEQRFPNGASAEGFLYLGDSLERATAVWIRHAMTT